MDDLVARLRERAADPARRTDAPQSMSFGGPGGTITTTFNTLGGLLGGQPGSTSNPSVPDLGSPAPTAAIEGAEARLGIALPTALRRLYTEVGDGGFGPGGGLLPIEEAVRAYAELTREPFLPNGPEWPAGLLPIVDQEPGYDCVDAGSGHVIAWDPEGLSERSGEKAWRRTFSEVAPSLEAWLSEWLDQRPAHELLQERIQQSMVEEARKARARIAAMTPDERRAMGLPDVGWEQVVWGGIGLDDDQA